MEQKTLKRSIVIAAGISGSKHAFSFAFHHRKKEHIKCHNVEIEILNYQELRDLYVNLRGLNAGVSPNAAIIDAAFCRDMHIFASGELYYISYPQVLLDSIQHAIGVAEIWAMLFVYKLFARIDLQEIYPDKFWDQKKLRHYFATSCEFSIESHTSVDV